MFQKRYKLIFGALAVCAVATQADAKTFSTDVPAAETPTAVAHSAGRTEALRVALLPAGAADEGARRFYEDTAYHGVWFDAGGAASRAEALIAALEDVASHALPANRYPVIALRAAVEAAKAGDDAAMAAAEIALTKTYLGYASDVTSGILEPRRIDRDLHVFPERPDAQWLMARLAQSTDPAAFIASLAPQAPGYDRLRAELARLDAIAGVGDWGANAPGGRSLKIGDRGPRVAAIRARLTTLGDLQPTAPVENVDGATPVDLEAFDLELETAVRGFQRRHGLNDDGVIGKRTIAAMNTSAAERAGQVRVSLERMRWMNRDLGHRHIIVNQADYNVRLVEGGETLFNERVVIGKARKHRTPEFSDLMSYLVLNPTWHVPRSIASKEILPKLQADPTYLQRNNMRLVSGGGTVDATAQDWSLYSASDFPFRVKQRPGSRNALGRVKFMFPNQFNIYLHDTPSKSLFKKDARAFSHGCVRVQDPMRLAEILLAPQTEDAPAYIQRVLGRGKERRVNFEEPVPVHLTYRTAWVTEDGERHFRADVYGRDARILSALQKAGVATGG